MIEKLCGTTLPVWQRSRLSISMDALARFARSSERFDAVVAVAEARR